MLLLSISAKWAEYVIAENEFAAALKHENSGFLWHGKIWADHDVNVYEYRIFEKCLNEKTDLSFYDRNREDLYNGLKECGFECIKPQGAFYLFVKSPVPNEKEFCETAKKYNILIVPGSSFACPGYVRLAYCVSHETIVNSLPKFKELAKEYF